MASYSIDCIELGLETPGVHYPKAEECTPPRIGSIKILLVHGLPRDQK